MSNNENYTSTKNYGGPFTEEELTVKSSKVTEVEHHDKHMVITIV